MLLRTRPGCPLRLGCPACRSDRLQNNQSFEFLLCLSQACLDKAIEKEKNWKRDRFLTEPSLAQPATRGRQITTKYLPVSTQRDLICLQMVACDRDLFFCGAHRSSGMIGSVRCKFKTSTWFCPMNDFCLDSLAYPIEGVKKEKKRKRSDLPLQTKPLLYEYACHVAGNMKRNRQRPCYQQ